jgi:dienelactone hydrolase
MVTRIQSVALCLAVVFLGSSVAQSQPLPGFSLIGENWTYDPGDGGSVISGILSTPSTNGRLPAILISHGMGGTASGFALPKARVMTNWGAVCIGPNYTHVTSTNVPENEGWCPENSRRARACLTILASLSYVDTNRIGAYGNSMGAFVTAGLCGQVSNRIHVAAITAGGSSGTANTNFASPAVQEIQPATAPFLMLHGTTDTTVLPEQSAILQSILTSNGVPNDRLLFDGIGHDLHNNPATRDDVYDLIQEWFTQWGLFDSTNAVPGNAASGRPRGIYVLDSSQGTQIGGVSMRDANIRSNAFVTGYVLRAAWETLEPAAGVYDFTIVSNILARLTPMGLKLSLILTPFDPPYIATAPGVATWQDVDRLGNPLTRAVPWDPYLLQQRARFLSALATNVFGGHVLRDHPLLDVIDPYLPGGFTGIRDPNVMLLRNLPGYTRSNLLYAVQHELRALTTNFPAKQVHIGFWKVQDNENASYGNLEAWEYIRRQLLAEFDGIQRPKVGFFMENLAASRPAPGADPITGYPVISYGEALYRSQTNTWAGFQALTSWSHPFTGIDKITNATPADGIAYAFEQYGSTYFELYVSDIDHAPYQADLSLWHQKLTASAPTIVVTPTNNGVVRLAWDRAAPLTQVEHTTNLGTAFHFIATITNLFEWTPADSSPPPTSWFRLRQWD